MVKPVHSYRIHEHRSQQQGDDNTRAIRAAQKREDAPLKQHVYQELVGDASTSANVPNHEVLLRGRIRTTGYPLQIAASFSGGEAGGVGDASVAIYVDGERRQAAGGDANALKLNLSLLLITDAAVGDHIVDLRWAAASAQTINCNPLTEPNEHHATLLVEEIE